MLRNKKRAVIKTKKQKQKQKNKKQNKKGSGVIT